ncbi:MAG: ArsC family reductase [Hydrogenophaga sp.]
MITLYGIPNCDTVKKARAWLTEQGAEYTFHDFKKQGVPTAEIEGWLKAVGWETLVNRQGTTWRKLEDSEKAAVVDAASAKTLVTAQSSVIKRPVVQWDDGAVTVGFNAEAWAHRI